MTAGQAENDKTKQRNVYIFSDLTEANFPQIAELQMNEDSHQCPWHHIQEMALDETDRFVVNYISERLRGGRFAVMNEATLWSRVNYPILALAETKQVKAWSEIFAEATFSHVILKGILDGVLGRTIGGLLDKPYFVIAEAKRGIESKDPRYQLYGQLLATALLNQQHEQTDQQITSPHYGCYIIAEYWTFVQAEVERITSSRPKLQITLSREYSSRFEIELIAKVLKRIVMDGSNRLQKIQGGNKGAE